MMMEPPSQPVSHPHPLRRASVACVACRERKIKCDGYADRSGKRTKTCTPCGRSDSCCVFRFDDRRKRPKKLQTAQIGLTDRHAHEGLRLQAEDNSNISIERPSLGNDLHKQATPHEHVPSARLTHQSSIEGSSASPASASCTPSSSNQPGSPNAFSPPIGYISTDDKGQVGYFGYTSNYHSVSVLPPPTPPQSPPPAVDLRKDQLRQIADSKSMQLHLLELYFTYQHPAPQALQEAIFMADYHKGVETQSYSPFLLYCLLLRACRLSNNPSVQDVSRIYLERAKRGLETELAKPKIATIQALCIFGHHLGSLGNDSACWLYPGMAFRLLFDLGLHQDCSDLLNAGYLTKHDQQSRYVALWGCYILDKLYSTYQGRPTSLKLADISAPRPDLDNVGEQYQALTAWIDLATILEAIAHLTNRPTKSLENPETLASLSAAGNKLLRWLRDLPDSLRWSKDKSPRSGLYALHMQFLAATILLHRPFAAYAQASETVPRRQLPDFTSQQSREICSENALRMVKLMLTFRELYGMKKIFSIVAPLLLSAALILIYEACADEPNKPKTMEKRYLWMCFEALEELSGSFPIVRRTHKILLFVLERCGRRELAPAAKQAKVIAPRMVSTQAASQYPPIPPTHDLTNVNFAAEDFRMFGEPFMFDSALSFDLNAPEDFGLGDMTSLLMPPLHYSSLISDTTQTANSHEPVLQGFGSMDFLGGQTFEWDKGNV